MPSTTPNIGLIVPSVNGDNNDWGGYLNSDLNALDAIFAPNGSGTSVGINHVGNTANATAGLFFLKDQSDATKVATFNAASISTGTTRTFTFPDISDTLVSLSATQTLANKTLNSPVFTGTATGTPTFGANVTFNEDIYMRKTADPSVQLMNATGNKGYRFLADVDAGADNGFDLDRFDGIVWSSIMSASASGAFVIGNPTGGFQSAGSLNVQDLYVNGVSLNPASSNAVAKAWVRFTVAQSSPYAVTVNNSYNVASVTRTGQGEYRVNFSSNQPNANYVAVCGGPSNGGSIPSVTTQEVDYVVIKMILGGGDDASKVNVLVFGD